MPKAQDYLSNIIKERKRVTLLAIQQARIDAARHALFLDKDAAEDFIMELEEEHINLE